MELLSKLQSRQDDLASRQQLRQRRVVETPRTTMRTAAGNASAAGVDTRMACRTAIPRNLG